MFIKFELNSISWKSIGVFVQYFGHHVKLFASVLDPSEVRSVGFVLHCLDNIGVELHLNSLVHVLKLVLMHQQVVPFLLLLAHFLKHANIRK